MKKIFKHIILWLYFKLHSVLTSISISLYNTEQEILKANPNDLKESDKKIQRMRHRNETLEKFYIGQTDNKYVKDYYEILKKSNRFIRTSTSHQIAVAADKHLRFENQNLLNENVIEVKDKYGRRYSHYGFFDGKHKYAGKTLAEVFTIEMEEKRTNDDDYEILYIFDNHPIETGLINVMDVIDEINDKNIGFEYKLVDMFKKSKQFDFPLKVYRENDNQTNKIEQLTEYLHVKKIGFEYRQLEFFIPIKFKTAEIENNSKIYDEIINIKSIFVKDDYGQLIGFTINKLIKRIMHNNTYEVWKFEGIEMKNMNKN